MKSLLSHFNFYFDFLESNALSQSTKFNDESRDNKKIVPIYIPFDNYPRDKICSINFIPPYVQLDAIEMDSNFSYIKVKRNQGFLIELSNYSNCSNYAKSHLGSHKRQILKRVKRLEECFPISYKLYFGDISENHYTALMKQLELFLRKRFAHKNAINSQLLRWEDYTKSVFQMILQKKASLFVMYNEKEPINISLNYHLNTTVVHTINAYDTNFSKFGLGNSAIYKMVEWSFANKCNYFDFQWGDLSYKRVWSTKVYTYQSAIFFQKDNFKHKILAYLTALFICFKEKLFHLNSGLYLGQWKHRNSLKMDEKSLHMGYTNYQFVDVLENYTISELVPIDIALAKYSYLLNAICDFQYLNFEASKDIKVYQLDDEYLILGKKTSKRLIFNAI